MKYKWLNKENNSEVIIFFNGWGMEENVVEHLAYDGHDVLMFFDYNNLETDFDFSTLSEYKKRSMVAWSMGVMISTIFAEKIGDVLHSTAINGTLKPIDKNFGIKPKVYDLTIKLFSKESRDKFVQNMFNTNILSSLTVKRTLENQKSELIAIKDYKANENFKFDRILISSDDLIIPTLNQVNYWKIEPNIQGGHCVFPLFKSWGELL